MFDSADFRISFIEFFEPVYIEGFGYKLQLALNREQDSSIDCPAIAEHTTVADPVMKVDMHCFIMKNNACVMVPGANIKFVSGHYLVIKSAAKADKAAVIADKPEPAAKEDVEQWRPRKRSNK